MHTPVRGCKNWWTCKIEKSKSNTFINMNISSCFYQCYCLSSQLSIRYYYIFLIRKKQKQLFTCSTLFSTFPCRCFARLKHKTTLNFLFNLQVLWRKCLCYCSLCFFNVAHFLTAAILFSCFSSNEICLHCYLFPCSSSFPVIMQVNVD